VKNLYASLVIRKERWGLTWWGRTILASILIAAASVGIVGIHPFLATNSPVAARILVVEGWVNEYVLRFALAEYQSGSYDLILCTGGPVTGLGGYINDAQTAASVAAGGLLRLGAPADVVKRVPSRVMSRDRTYGAARALRAWFADERMTVTSFNIVTEDAHGRRTRLLYQKAFGPRVDIGIISVPNPDYDATHWWRYSSGVREILSETVGYLYARLLFHPSSRESSTGAVLRSRSGSPG